MSICQSILILPGCIFPGGKGGGPGGAPPPACVPGAPGFGGMDIEGGIAGGIDPGGGTGGNPGGGMPAQKIAFTNYEECHILLVHNIRLSILVILTNSLNALVTHKRGCQLSCSLLATDIT